MTSCSGLSGTAGRCGWPNGRGDANGCGGWRAQRHAWRGWAAAAAWPNRPTGIDLSSESGERRNCRAARGELVAADAAADPAASSTPLQSTAVVRMVKALRPRRLSGPFPHFLRWLRPAVPSRLRSRPVATGQFSPNRCKGPRSASMGCSARQHQFARAVQAC